MKCMSGPEACIEIRQKLHFRGKIIGVTGNALPSDIKNFKECGADDVIVKPFLMDQLLQILSSALTPTPE